MPVARYFLFVGGALLALLFVVNAIVPQDDVVATANISSPAFDKSTVRIRSIQKLPERVVFDTSLPAVVPPQATAVAPAATALDLSAKARVRDTFAQFVPADAKDRAAPVAKPLEQQAQASPAQVPNQPPKKRKVVRHTNPPTQLQPMRLAQPGAYPYPYRPFRIAQQQQQRFGFFGGFGTW